MDLRFAIVKTVSTMSNVDLLSLDRLEYPKFSGIGKEGISSSTAIDQVELQISKAHFWFGPRNPGYVALSHIAQNFMVFWL